MLNIKKIITWKCVFKLLNGSVGVQYNDGRKIKKTKDYVFSWELAKDVRVKAVDYKLSLFLHLKNVFDNCPICNDILQFPKLQQMHRMNYNCISTNAFINKYIL